MDVLIDEIAQVLSLIHIFWSRTKASVLRSSLLVVRLCRVSVPPLLPMVNTVLVPPALVIRLAISATLVSSSFPAVSYTHLDVYKRQPMHDVCTI